jgi:hypothetical protein
MNVTFLLRYARYGFLRLLAASVLISPLFAATAGSQPPDGGTNIPVHATLEITQPPDGAVLPAGKDVEIHATAIDPLGYIPRVEFYDGTARIGVSEIAFLVEPPPGTPIQHSLVWTNPAPGDHVLTAKALTARGEAVVSNPVHVTIQKGITVVRVSAPDPQGTEFSPLVAVIDAAVFEISRDGPTNDALTVFFSLHGTATPNVDYRPVSSPVQIPAGARSANVIISPAPDDVMEPMETVGIQLEYSPLAGPQTSYQIDTAHTHATAVIYDKHPPENGALELSFPDDNATYAENSPIYLAAAAFHPSVSLSRVVFYSDDMQIGVSELPSAAAGGLYLHSIIWEHPAPGRYEITARAALPDGSEIVSSVRNIRVGPEEGTTVKIIQPHDGTVFNLGQTIGIYAESTGVGSLYKLDLLADDHVLASTNPPVLTFNWVNAPAGTHTLRAVLYIPNSEAPEITSEPVRILVQEGSRTGFVSRDLPGGFTPGKPFSAALSAKPFPETRGWAIQEQPPKGWLVSNITGDGTFDPQTGSVKFGPFTDASPRVFGYEVTPPAGADGQAEFGGTSSADGKTYPIGGDHLIAQASQFHPADQNGDSRIQIDEVTAYAAAWKSAGSWPVPPSPVPLDFLTRAAMLWRRGEAYHYAPDQGAPPSCWVSDAPSTQVVAMVVSSAIRGTIPASGIVAPGQPMQVTIHVQPAPGVAACAIEEQVPDGWSVADISDGGSVTNGVIRWGLFLDNAERSLTYKLVAPSTVTSIGTIEGTASFDGVVISTSGPNNAASINTSAPLSLSVAQSVNGAAHLHLSGPAGQPCVLDASSDLIRWTPVESLFLPDGQLDFEDFEMAGGDRYYRLRVQ